MNLQLESAWLITVLLVSLRLAPLFFATPLDGFGRLPGRIRVFLLFAIALVLSSSGKLQLVSGIDSLVDLLVVASRQLLLGAILAFGIYTSFGVYMIAGRVLDFQSGFGAASLLNPADNSQNPLYGTILSMCAMSIFFLTDAHHLLLRFVLFSFDVFPLGGALISLPMDEIVTRMGVMMSLGVVLAGPIVLMLFLVDVGIAVMARTMPQMNVYFLFLPLKIFLSLVMMASMMLVLMPFLEHVMTSTIEYWQRALAS